LVKSLELLPAFSESLTEISNEAYKKIVKNEVVLVVGEKESDERLKISCFSSFSI